MALTNLETIMADMNKRGKMNRLYVPTHLRDGLANWIYKGRPVGSYLTAILEGDLFEAGRRGDELSIDGMGSTVRWLLCFAPMNCYGSKEQVKAWRESGGYVGRNGGASHG